MDRLARLAPYATIAVAVAIVFGQSVHFGLLKWDDRLLITQNTFFLPLTGDSVVQLMLSVPHGLFMPLTYAYWALLAVIGQALDGTGKAVFDPRVFHFGNLLLHAGCGMLVYAIAFRLVGSRLAACLGALVFLLHPLQLETVCWASEAKGLLAAVFSLASLLLMTPKPGAMGTAPTWRQYVLALACFFLALLSKPSAVALPVLVGAMQYFAARRPLSEVALGMLPWFALAAYWVTLAQGAQPTDGMAPQVTLLERPFIAGDTLAFYLVKLVKPLPVTIDYGRMPLVALESPWIHVAWILPVFVGIVGWFVAREAASRVGVVIFFASLLPVTGLVAFQFQRFSTVADRYMYVPIVGVGLIVAALVARGGRAVAAMGAVAVVVLGSLSWSQAASWRDDQSLFSHALSVNPRCYTAMINLAATYLEKGDELGAEGYYKLALESPQPLQNAYAGEARILFGRRQFAEARALYDGVLKDHPKLDWAHAGAGQACHYLGDTRRAREHYRVALTPNSAGGSDVMIFERARIANNLARILATDNDAALRDGQEAIERAREANAITRSQAPGYLDTLAAAYAEAGDFDQAVQVGRLAVERAAAAQNRELADRLTEHVRLFEAHKPLRESAAEQMRRS